MDLNTRKILSLFASILFTIPVYIILHEGGHALIALSCGARITEFSILGAYMRYEGGTFTALTLSLFYIAGMLLPVLISIAYMLLYRDAAQSVFYRIFSFVFPLSSQPRPWHGGSSPSCIFPIRHPQGMM